MRERSSGRSTEARRRSRVLTWAVSHTWYEPVLIEGGLFVTRSTGAIGTLGRSILAIQLSRSNRTVPARRSTPGSGVFNRPPGQAIRYFAAILVKPQSEARISAPHNRRITRSGSGKRAHRRFGPRRT
jgi:hypothetical protein